MEEVEVRAAAPAAALAWTWTSQNTRNHLRNQLRIQVSPGPDLEKLRGDRPAVRASTTYISVLVCVCVLAPVCADEHLRPGAPFVWRRLSPGWDQLCWLMKGSITMATLPNVTKENQPRAELEVSRWSSC